MATPDDSWTPLLCAVSKLRKAGCLGLDEQPKVTQVANFAVPMGPGPGPDERPKIFQSANSEVIVIDQQGMTLYAMDRSTSFLKRESTRTISPGYQRITIDDLREVQSHVIRQDGETVSHVLEFIGGTQFSFVTTEDDKLLETFNCNAVAQRWPDGQGDSLIVRGTALRVRDAVRELRLRKEATLMRSATRAPPDNGWVPLVCAINQMKLDGQLRADEEALVHRVPGDFRVMVGTVKPGELPQILQSPSGETVVLDAHCATAYCVDRSTMTMHLDGRIECTYPRYRRIELNDASQVKSHEINLLFETVSHSIEFFGGGRFSFLIDDNGQVLETFNFKVETKRPGEGTPDDALVLFGTIQGLPE